MKVTVIPLFNIIALFKNFVHLSDLNPKILLITNMENRKLYGHIETKIVQYTAFLAVIFQYINYFIFHNIILFRFSNP
jgi:hypothetical protein